MEIYEVKLSRKAENNLIRLPRHIIFKLQIWIDGVRTHGLSEIRKRPGFHDEPLRGKRQGQRSIRLNNAYRAIYEIDRSGTIHFIDIIEVNKHEY